MAKKKVDIHYPDKYKYDLVEHGDWGQWRTSTGWPSGSKYDGNCTIKSDYGGGVTFRRGDNPASTTKSSSSSVSNVYVNPHKHLQNWSVYDHYGKSSKAHNVYMIMECAGYIPNMNGFDVRASNSESNWTDWQIGQIWMGSESASGSKSKHKCYMKPNAWGNIDHKMHDSVTGTFGNISNWTPNQTTSGTQYWRVETNDNMSNRFVKWIVVIWTIGTKASAAHTHGFCWRYMCPRLQRTGTDSNKGNILFYPTSTRSTKDRKIILL